MILLSCRDLTMTYDGAAAVEHVSFDVEAGDVLCIVGENGSGKSTLLKGLLGLLPVKEGEVLYQNGLRRDRAGYLPQQTPVQRDFPASVWEVVLSGCLSRKRRGPFYSAHDRARAESALDRLSIGDLRRRPYRELSGGQQQRVLLARALCATERLLLLDEPVTGLDPVVTAEFYGLIGRLNREDGVAVVMVSHDIKSAAGISTKILHLAKSVLFFGSAEAYRASETGRFFLEGRAHD